MSGAEPCTGSNMLGSPGAPSEALGSMPIEPVSIAASSLRMSPNMLSVRITSKRCRRRDELHRGVVDEDVLEADLANSLSCTRTTVSRHRRGRLEDVGLVDARDAPARGPECDPRDPLDLARGVDVGVRRARLRARLLAEVDAARELAHDEEVGALDDLAAQRARVRAARRAGRTGRRFA
jgi:hypothetical protein